jgi:hypothetical protein
MKVDTVKTRRRIEEALRKAATPDTLTRVAELLGVEVAYLPETCGGHQCHSHCCPPDCSYHNRPCFGPKQVRCPCQLKKGETFWHVHTGIPREGTYSQIIDHRYSFRRALVLVEGPYQQDQGYWWIKIRNVGGGEEEIPLSAMSIVPYGDGTWNGQNYIAFGENHTQCGFHHCHSHCQERSS